MEAELHYLLQDEQNTYKSMIQQNNVELNKHTDAHSSVFVRTCDNKFPAPNLNPKPKLNLNPNFDLHVKAKSFKVGGSSQNVPTSQKCPHFAVEMVL